MVSRTDFHAMSYRIPFNRPTSLPESEASLREVVREGRLSGNGRFTHECEQQLARLTGAAHALLTGSCTAALEMSALLLDARPGDEVIVPSFTFVSTANAVAMRGLIPVFADCRVDTLNIDEQRLAELISPRTRAIIVMHYGGVACEMDEIGALADRHGLSVIEDNAHGLFAHYKGRPLGSLGTMATQSFHETKNVTCGEGGALLLNDRSLRERAEIIREKGTNRSRFFRGEVDRYTWVDLGSNYLASELQAAYLAAQLRKHEDVQRKRRILWDRYNTALADWACEHGVGLPVVPEHCEHPSHVFHLMLPTASSRTRLIDALKQQGILAVFHYQALHLSPMGRRLGGTPGACPVSEDVSERVLRLPFYTDLSTSDQDVVIHAVRAFRP